MTPCPTMLRLLLRYEPETGRLFWRERPLWMFRTTPGRTAAHAQKQWNLRYAGKPADEVLVHGYRMVTIFKTKLRAHRAIWAMATGAWPDDEIDHEDGITTNNRLGNLRDTTHAGNMKNQKLRVDNKSGVPGVYHNGKKWQVQVSKAGKTTYVGVYDLLTDAIEARRLAAERLGYHRNHGRKTS